MRIISYVLLVFLVMILIYVSLGSHSQAIRNRYSEHNKLNLRSRDDDNTHNPESLEERGRGNAPETGRRLNPARAGNVAPNLPALRREPSPFRAGRRTEVESSRIPLLAST